MSEKNWPEPSGHLETRARETAAHVGGGVLLLVMMFGWGYPIYRIFDGNGLEFWIVIALIIGVPLVALICGAFSVIATELWLRRGDPNKFNADEVCDSD